MTLRSHDVSVKWPFQSNHFRQMTISVNWFSVKRFSVKRVSVKWPILPSILQLTRIQVKSKVKSKKLIMLSIVFAEEPSSQGPCIFNLLVQKLSIVFFDGMDTTKYYFQSKAQQRSPKLFLLVSLVRSAKFLRE
jgi:hypothetical protein